ncbi:hypothetical protein [Halomicrococcus gelatinilyticus]|uniref:hypothetical protein n=1 Tax=Halomicrococcus gelatinilyticus TaxID=1702103 RepID=UPI002E0E95ED
MTPQTPTVATTADDAPTPKSYPDRPAQPSGDALREFVKATERAYTHNRILRRESATELGYVDVKFVSIADVERSDDGTVVDVTVEFGYSTGDPGETAGTHADGAQRVSYFLGEHVVCRVEKPRAEYPDPRTTDGTVLWCTPASE